MVNTLVASNRKLQNYKLQSESVTPLSEKFIDKASNIWSNSDYYEPTTAGLKIAHGIHNAIEGVKFFTYGVGALVSSDIEKNIRRKKLAEIIGCNPNIIAMDINELMEKQETTQYYGEDFTYSCQTNKDWLRNIKMIWGDAHLQALDDMNCFENLESIWGNAFFSRSTDLSGLSLKLVHGDIHGEKLVTTDGLEELMYVGGTIYYRNKEFKTLSEFYEYINIKEAIFEK